MNTDPRKYDYILPILYENREEEQEAVDIGVKTTTISSTGRSMGKSNGSTYLTSQEFFKDNYRTGNYIKWKQLRKYYARHLESNPFEKGDKVRCIKNTTGSPDKSVGDVFTIERKNSDPIYIHYKQNFSATYKDFEFIFPLTTNSDKDWRDPFITDDEEKIKSSGADTILIKRCGTCNEYAALMAYVTQFKSGGFWFEKDKLYFVTNGTESNKYATYESAKQFLIEWNEKELL